MSGNVQKDSAGILCDMCIGEDRKPARKTCMKCEISMCVQHLQAHLTTPVLLQTHPLTEPMALDESTKCPQHGKLLEYYCLDDMTCVCVSCAIEDQHRLHNMKTFSTAHKELMEKLTAEQQLLKEKTDDDNLSLEKWEKREREKVSRCSVRLIQAVTNLRDVSLTSVQSSVSARMVSIKTSRSSMQAAQKEKDTFRFLQMFSQVNQDVENDKAVDLSKGLEPGSHRDKLVQDIIQDGKQIMTQASNFVGSLLTLVDPENHQELITTSSDVIFEPQSLGSGVSLSKDKRKVFYNSWLGPCSATLLVQSTKSTPNCQRWIISLTKESDWMIGLCDKQSVTYPKNGPVYGLCCEDNHLSCVTTEYEAHPDASTSSGGFKRQKLDVMTPGAKFMVCSELLTYQDENQEIEVPPPETVEVFWNSKTSELSFFSRIGKFQREEMITVETSINTGDLVSFVQLGKENAHQPQLEWKCSCGWSSYSNPNQTSCPRCRKLFMDKLITEMVCELL